MMRRLLLLFFVPALAQAEGWNVKLAQGTSPTLQQKPAEIYFLSQDGETSSATNAALLARYSPDVLNIETLPWLQSELWLGASLARNSLKTKPVHLRTAGVGINANWSTAQSFPIFKSDLSYNREEDRIKGTRGHMARLDVYRILACPAGNASSGEVRPSFTCYPYAGYYRRRISKTDDPVLAPVGSLAGPFIGFFVKLEFGEVLDVGEWAVPFSIEVDAYRLRENNVSAAYAKAYYKHASLALNYAFDTGGSNWKPRISLVRETGTDRLANQERGSSTKLAFQVSYTFAPPKP